MRTLTSLVIAVFLAAASGVFWASYAYFKALEIEKASARLSLFSGTVEAELQRFAHLPYVLARDPLVIETAQRGDTAPLNRKMAEIAQRSGLEAIYLMDTAGLTLAASNAGQPGSFVGQNYGFRPYFLSARANQPGEFYGIGATTGVPGYFFAEPVLDAQGAIVGVIAIKIDLSTLQNSWYQAGERIILANSDGVTLLASELDWRYRSLAPLSPAQQDRIAEARQFPNEPLAPMDWTPNRPHQTAKIGRDDFLYVVTDDLPNDWSLHFFAPDDQAVTSAWLTTGAVLLIGGGMVFLLQLQRVRRIGAALRRSEYEEALLRASNERLAIEIEERRAAEARLQKTQAELERAGRLAALGQLASSVTHELGQPLAAMRNRLATAELQGQTTPLIGQLQALAERMEGITRQLKFFSRKGRDKFEILDLREAIRAAADLVEPDLALGTGALVLEMPDTPIEMQGNRLRIEQVVTNLLRNALDAMDDVQAPQIIVSLGETETSLWFSVADNGHGLGGKSLDDLKEPFATTRESGQGMGLGLTISAGIVSDHDGEMTAKTRETGGAVFEARFPKPPPREERTDGLEGAGRR